MYFINTYGKDLLTVADAYEYAILIGNQEALRRIDHPLYLCPFCLRNYIFYQDGEFFETEIFTEDHFPPLSVGGEKTVLVCKPCNSSFGSEIDYSLKEYLQFQRFILKKDKSSYPMKFSYHGVPGKYGVQTTWENGNLIQSVPFKLYPLVKKWMYDIEKKEWKFKMHITAPAQEHIHKALLRAAYLWCFYNWGYDFVFSKNAQHMRKVLAGKEKHPLSNLGVFGDAADQSLSPGFYFVSSPEHLQSTFVNFEIKIKDPDYSEKMFVLIPGRMDRCWNAMKNYEFLIEKKTADFSLVKLKDNCVEKGIDLAYSRVWQEFFIKGEN